VVLVRKFKVKVLFAMVNNLKKDADEEFKGDSSAFRVFRTLSCASGW